MICEQCGDQIIGCECFHAQLKEEPTTHEALTAMDTETKRLRAEVETLRKSDDAIKVLEEIVKNRRQVRIQFDEDGSNPFGIFSNGFEEYGGDLASAILRQQPLILLVDSTPKTYGDRQ